MNHRDENIIEIAWVHEYLLLNNCYPNKDYDSIDSKLEILNLAEIFEKKFKGIDWNKSCLDYYEEIDKFARSKLMEWNINGAVHNVEDEI